jgi:hypothetical protein
MATIKEIQKALKADPDLLNRIPNLREFVNEHREDFAFLFKDQPKNKVKEVQNSEVRSDVVETRRWNPKITQI